MEDEFTLPFTLMIDFFLFVIMNINTLWNVQDTW